jgi:hypothetical protein
MRSASTLNTSETRGYDYLHAIRPRAHIQVRTTHKHRSRLTPIENEIILSISINCVSFLWSSAFSYLGL